MEKVTEQQDYTLFFKFIDRYHLEGFSTIKESDALIQELEELTTLNNQFFYFNNEAQAENTNFEALWKNDTIRFSTHSQQFQRNNSLNLMGEIALGNEKTSLHFIESEINLLKDKWHFDPLNAVTLYKDSISFSNFSPSIGFHSTNINSQGKLFLLH